MALPVTGAPAVLVVTGASGAGKTSILRVAAGLLRPAYGRVDANGSTWLDTDRDIDVPADGLKNSDDDR